MRISLAPGGGGLTKKLQQHFREVRFTGCHEVGNRHRNLVQQQAGTLGGKGLTVLWVVRAGLVLRARKLNRSHEECARSRVVDPNWVLIQVGEASWSDQR